LLSERPVGNRTICTIFLQLNDAKIKQFENGIVIRKRAAFCHLAKTPLSIASNIGPKTSFRAACILATLLGLYSAIMNSSAGCVSIFSFHIFLLLYQKMDYALLLTQSILHYRNCRYIYPVCFNYRVA